IDVGICELGRARLMASVCYWLRGRRCGCCINKSDLCAASQDNEIRRNVRAPGYQLQLLLFFRFDSPLTRQRLKFADQQTSLDLSCDVEIRRLGKRGDVRPGNENLARLEQQRFPEAIRQITSNYPFQDKNLHIGLAMTLDYARRSCASHCDHTGFDLQMASAFRYLEKQSAFAQIYSACSVTET